MNNELETFRIEQLEKAMEEHEKNCLEYRDKVEKRLDVIEKNQIRQTTIMEQSEEKLDKLIDKVSENEKGILTTKTKLAVIGTCIVVGIGIAGFIIRYGPVLLGG